MSKFNAARARSQEQTVIDFPARPSPPAEMVTVTREEWERVNRLLKHARGDRKRQAQCIADLKGDCDRLYRKSKAMEVLVESKTATVEIAERMADDAERILEEGLAIGDAWRKLCDMQESMIDAVIAGAREAMDRRAA